MSSTTDSPRQRSMFLPLMLLVAFAVVSAGFVFAFLPVVTCNVCFGLGAITTAERQEYFNSLGSEQVILPILEGWECEWCSGIGKVAPRRKWTMTLPSHLRRTKRDKLEVELYLEWRRARK